MDRFKRVQIKEWLVIVVGLFYVMLLSFFSISPRMVLTASYLAAISFKFRKSQLIWSIERSRLNVVFPLDTIGSKTQ